MQGLRGKRGFEGVPNMEKRVSTVIIEPRLVLREALELLMGNHSYRVVGGLASIAEIACSSVIPDGPELVILGAQAADNAAKGAEVIRTRWPDSKIIFLFDDASPADFQNMLVSQIDGCIPLSVSPASFDEHVGPDRDEERADNGDGRQEARFEMATSRTVGGRERDGQAALERCLGRYRVWDTALGASGKRGDIDDRDSCTGQAHVVETKTPTLSEREIQILDGLVKGYANKVIGRRCDIS